MEPTVAKGAQDNNDTIVSLSKRRGFVYPSSEIYGGSRSAWDYGPLGVELKENVRRQWWKSMVQTRDDVVGLDSAVILARDVWVASGHVETFSDPLSECQSCHKRFRADHLEEAYEAKHNHPPANGLADINCPNCGTKGAFTEPRQFSGLLKTYLGPVESEEGLHYLRPETAQGIFVNFLNVMTSARKKPPFGIAQTGKSFRNEITPGNFIFRTREFEQMEMEFFVEPGTDEQWHDYWLQERWNWYIGLGLHEENLRFFEHPKEKLSHYSKRTVDIEYRFRFGGKEFDELEGIANRTDFDLKAHTQHSGVDLSYFDQEKGERWTPYVVEPAAGLTRATLAFLLDAYGAQRIFDAGVLAPLAWVARHGDERVAALALFGLGAAFLASYERARGQSLGYRGSEGVGYRAVRVAILAAALLTGRLEPLLWVFLALTVAAAAVRAWNVALQQRGSTARMEGAP
jgi:glycyl-tRNA synthetase